MNLTLHRTYHPGLRRNYLVADLPLTVSQDEQRFWWVLRVRAPQTEAWLRRAGLETAFHSRRDAVEALRVAIEVYGAPEPRRPFAQLRRQPDGTYVCGRYLVEPNRDFGSGWYVRDQKQHGRTMTVWSLPVARWTVAVLQASEDDS